MEKITIVIPNYNGASLLQKYLPSVIKYSPNCEIIVVDDASQDESVKIVRKNFKKVKIIRLAQNSGFAYSANIGVKSAKTKIVLLLNTDVAARRNYLSAALKHFKDTSIFAVALEDESHERGKIIPRGRGGARFTKGFFEHFAVIPERGATLWASGGSSMISREIFLKLKGFDTVFKPFYWEDVDLGYRAWKHGYKCVFEPLSKVDHYHEEGTIQNTSSKLRIRTVAYKNQFLFMWKNIEDYHLILLHLFWMPYHALMALTRLDLAFFSGLAIALFALPSLVIATSQNVNVISDKNILKMFK